jgi:hypothetical protein
MNLLPCEIQDYIYTFDGRYKRGMAACFERIKQRRYSSVGINRHTRPPKHFNKREYDLEVQRRVAIYRALLELRDPDNPFLGGHIRGVTTHLRKPQVSYVFKDAIGVYMLGMVKETIIVDGRSYVCSEKTFSVARYEGSREPHGTESVVKQINLTMDEDDLAKNGVRGQVFRKIIAPYWKEGYEFETHSRRPPASLAAATERFSRLKTPGKYITMGKEYTVCTKTGIGLLYDKKGVVAGYLTKGLKFFLHTD